MPANLPPACQTVALQPYAMHCCHLWPYKMLLGWVTLTVESWTRKSLERHKPQILTLERSYNYITITCRFSSQQRCLYMPVLLMSHCPRVINKSFLSFEAAWDYVALSLSVAQWYSGAVNNEPPQPLTVGISLSWVWATAQPHWTMTSL